MSYIGIPPFGQTARTVTSFIATESQTVFTPTGGYIVNYIDVYYNGVKLVNGDDYVATNGTSVTLTVAANAGDTIETMVYMPVSLTDTYRTGEVDAGFVGKTSSTGAALMPVGTTAERPNSPSTGMYRMNSTTGEPEWYDTLGSVWVPFKGATYAIEYLVIAGGGSGDYGGGGAGGYRCSVSGELSGTNYPAEQPLSVDSNVAYKVVIGAGGAAYADGSPSVFGPIVSVGGGGGMNHGGNGRGGRTGGSGVGSRYVSSAGGFPGYGIPGQGFSGGGAPDGVSTYTAGGGGGGAGAAGVNSTSVNAGAGGAGIASSITGSSVTRGGGGGGGTNAGAGGAGGAGGGGAGASSLTVNNGTANTGGGGGAGNGNSGSGGSGIVIILYEVAQRATGGTVTSSGGYTIHTFTSSGTFRA
jgi:hypothetical protein